MQRFNLAQTLYTLSNGSMFSVREAMTESPVTHTEYVLEVPSRSWGRAGPRRGRHFGPNMRIQAISTLEFLLPDDVWAELSTLNDYESLRLLASVPDREIPEERLKRLLLIAHEADLCRLLTSACGYPSPASFKLPDADLILDPACDGERLDEKHFHRVFVPMQQGSRYNVLDAGFRSNHDKSATAIFNPHLWDIAAQFISLQRYNSPRPWQASGDDHRWCVVEGLAIGQRQGPYRKKLKRFLAFYEALISGGDGVALCFHGTSTVLAHLRNSGLLESVLPKSITCPSTPLLSHRQAGALYVSAWQSAASRQHMEVLRPAEE